MPLTRDTGFAAAVVDQENRPVALIQVKASALGPNWAPLLRRELERLEKYTTKPAFLLAIDPSSIYLYRLSGNDLSEPIVRLDTAKVLQHYEPEFGKQQVFERYLITLVEAWLRDLAYHWKSPNPPGADELREAGLLGKVEGGTTLSFEG